MKIRFNFYKIYLEDEITRIMVGDDTINMSFNVKVNGISQPFINEDGTLLINIPQNCPTEVDVTLEANFEIENDNEYSFSDAFSNGFDIEENQSLDQRVKYKNTFTFYGFDETIDILLRQANEGFNEAFNTGFRRYRSITAQYDIVHKPFTDEYYYYDTSGQLEELENLLEYKYEETIDQDLTDHNYTTRNTMYNHCVNDEVTFTKRRYEPVESNCGCGSRNIVQSYLEEATYSYKLKYIERDYADDFNTVIYGINNKEDCIVLNQKNRALVYINYNLKKRFIDDIKLYALKKDLVQFQLIDYKGNVLDTYEEEIADFDNFGKLEFEFIPPRIGSYFVKTIIYSYDHCDNIVRERYCVKEIRVSEELVLDNTDCLTKITNCSLHDKHIDIYELVDIDTWELERSTVISKSDVLELRLDDGIYKVVDNDQEYIYYNFCNLIECLIQMTREINCGNCDIGKEYIALGIHVNTLFAKTDKYHNYFTNINLANREELGTIKDIIERAHEYCHYTECKTC